MTRLVLLLLFAVVATSAAPAGESDTEFCAGETECPADCSYVSRNANCVFCQCGPDKLQTGEIIVNAAEGCPPGTVLNQQLGETQTCLPGGPGVPTGDGCPYGKSFIDECSNDCNCIDGKFYGCTRKLCRPGQTPEKPMSCESSNDLPERSKRRVVCHEDIVKVQDEDDKCLPGSFWNNDCNSCFCNAGGQSGCSFALCPEREEQSEGCPYGKSFIDECGNDCNCVDGKFYGCTRKLCMPGQTPEKPMSCKSSDDLPERSKRRVVCHEDIVKVQDEDEDCFADSFWKDDCNSCFCTSRGTPGCTLKLCLPENEAKPKTGCKYGDAFIDECGNQCNCQNGEFYGCTLKACESDQLRAEVPMTCTGPADVPQVAGSRVVCHQGIVKVQNKDEPCIPDSEYMDECNACTCSGTSELPVPACTFKACLPQLRSGECQYGPAYIDECGNDCTCVNGMFYGCSKRGCPEGKTAEKPLSCEGPRELPTRRNRRVVCHAGIVKIQKEEDKCLPDSTFMNDCNSCFCSDTGASGCTLIGCSGFEGPKEACPHGDAFVDECGNTCQCVNNEFYGCTFKACKEGETPQLPMKCKGRTDLPEVANKRVVCHQGIVKLQDEGDNCLPNSTYWDDCNQCFCNENGAAGCTRKFCLSVSPPARACTPGTRYKKDCNICSCLPSMWEVCTSNSCPPAASTPAGPLESSGCPHGDNFIDECNNDCTCNDDQFYTCSRKGCKPGERSEQPMSCSGGQNLPKRAGSRVFCHDGKVKFQDADDKCVPGSTFMNECNSCVCSPGGVSGCTLKICL